jgi:hypothetical protein
VGQAVPNRTNFWKSSKAKGREMMHKRTEDIISLKTRIIQHKFILVFVVLALSIFRSLESRWGIQQGDAAGFVDAMSDQSSTGDINFTYGFSLDALRELFSLNPNEIDNDSFLFNRSEKPFIHWHPYLLGYAIRILPNLFEVQVLPLFLLASSYALGLVLLLKQIHLSSISNLKKLSLFIPTILSPILVEAINGQPYFDKLFFGPCIAILLLLLLPKENQTFRIHKIVFLLILSYTFSERVSLMAAVMVLGVLIVCPKETGIRVNQKVVLFITCFFGILWYIIWNQFISWNPDMQNTSIKYFVPNLQELLFGFRRQNFLVFISNVLPFLLLTFFNLRFFVIAFFSIVPNLIVSIGGAELSGYSTHYHSVYLPILISLSLLSIIKTDLSPLTKKYQSAIIFLAITVSIVGSSNYISSQNNAKSTDALRIHLGNVADAFGLIPKSKYEVRNVLKTEYQDLFSGIRKNIGMSISAPESLMPSLTSVGFGSIDYFPVGVGSDDLLVVPFTDPDFTKVEVSIYGLVPIESRDKWSRTILEVLEKSYKLISKKSGSFGNIAIYVKT